MKIPLLFALVPSENKLKSSNSPPSEELIGKLVDQYGDDVLRLAYMYLRDRQLAEDAFQEVFIKVYKKYHTFRKDSGEKTWLMRITINVCKDMLRGFWWKRVKTTFLPEQPDDQGTPEQLVTARDANRRLWEEVLRLPPLLKDAVILYYYEEMETPEISQVLGVPEGTVRSRLHRARTALKTNWKGGD
ncbi:sigma-70 family RNA polymerase sigma factor [Paenibacillus senegalensis]|uniref:sigma-70 family RNA polymerase sigma factor n=1 Tax=Paenibacillus senegalensis TaxID=1465766 RepID=UPI000287A4EB|nr:sigma-70 family RNA polymerase sigma factor [Paenibacillus senegalensis]